ncbi:DNA translocase FtsK [Adlercreutzia sp. ZJ138]|uniref:FtsK/SpoIIIE family DNA translocase n=1 Tax=Adlercreutzia sp. ZJ138 TaxID=2709405 RepID=UPI001F15664C|nr:DNA translocase FtsK [Adlercreutzia sp. ZJ138]
MANRSSSKTASRGKGNGNSSKRSSQRSSQRGRRLGARPADGERMLDDRARREIAGVVFAIVALVLFVIAVMPTDALLSHLLSGALHLSVGLGAYLIPVFLLIVGATFVVNIERQQIPARVSLGLALILFAILVLLSLFTPNVTPEDPSALFEEEALVARGGYVGAGIAWLGVKLLGQPVSCIIMVGVIVIGLVVIGFSLSKLIDRVRAIREQREAQMGEQPHGAKVPLFAAGKANRAASAHDVDDQTSAQMDERLAATDTRVLPVLPGQVRASRSGRRTSRAAVPATSATPAASSVTASLDPSESTSLTRRLPDMSGKAGKTQALTRKLGHRADQADQTDREKDSVAATRKAAGKKPATPMATPHPSDGFELPPMSLLAVSKDSKRDQASDAELQETAACLQETLEDFNIMAQVVGWVAGPTVTLYKVDLPAGVRVSRVTALQDDIALALAAPGVRIFAPIPGTNFVGIEVPNRTRQMVLLGDVLKEAPDGPLQIAIGKDVEGHCIVSDLARMPHLLIAGTTGSGKSVSIHGMIMSILMRATPSEVRFIMIDPKRVEFILYNGIPHLYVPVVTDPKEASSALSWGVAEMERRLKVFSKMGVRNIGQYNAEVQSGALEDDSCEELPYIVIVIDELADLMMNVGKEVEFSISRIAQLARAAGIHLIIATQRPSTNVVTGLIKANITNRIALNVASSIDSRVILDSPGAEKLIGRGDLLLSKPEYAKPQRIQGCWVEDDEINAVVEVLKAQGEPEYHSEILQTNLITLGASQPDGSGGSGTADDPRLWEAADIVVSTGLGSTSNIQRRLSVGYSRAGRIMDMLEEKGVVGPPNGSKPREVLVDAMELETLKAFEAQDAASGED